MTFQRTTNPITMIPCPHCNNVHRWPDYCTHCGGRGWVRDPAQTITIEPDVKLTYGIDPSLYAFLVRLEEKLDRLLAALADGDT